MSTRIKLPSSGKAFKHIKLANHTGKQTTPHTMVCADVPDSVQKPPTVDDPVRQSYKHKSDVSHIKVQP